MHAGNPETAFGLAVGDRIELVAMGNDPAPMTPGATGTVAGFCTLPGLEQIWVRWDPAYGRGLHLVPGVDRWRRLADAAPAGAQTSRPEDRAAVLTWRDEALVLGTGINEHRFVALCDALLEAWDSLAIGLVAERGRAEEQLTDEAQRTAIYREYYLATEESLTLSETVGVTMGQWEASTERMRAAEAACEALEHS